MKNSEAPGNSFPEKLAWLKTNAQSNGDYLIEVSADCCIAPQKLSYKGKGNITLKGLSNDDNDDNSTLIYNDNSLVTVRSGASNENGASDELGEHSIWDSRCVRYHGLEGIVNEEMYSYKLYHILKNEPQEVADWIIGISYALKEILIA